MTTAAIYARVSSARQAKDETIGSQLAAVTSHAGQQGLDVPAGWVFTDDGHSGATLVRPGLERLRDLIAQVPVEVVVCYSPDRLARKFAYQALLIEEFTRAGTRVEFVKGPRGDSPEDQLLVQFQGMFAEYEKAQILERSRRGKAHRAKAGSVNVLGGAPFGYRYHRKTPDSGAVYEICEHEAVLVAEMFRRYTDEAASIADLARWLTEQNVPTRTGKPSWDRSVIWAMLRNPAYAGTAMFGKTISVQQPAGSTGPPGWPAGPPRPRTRPSTDPNRNGPPSRSRRSSPSRPSPGPNNDWPTTNDSPPGTPRSHPCCKDSPPARTAGTPTTGPAPAPPTRKSSTTGAWARTTTGTPADGSAPTPRSGPTTSTKSSGTTSPR